MGQTMATQLITYTIMCKDPGLTLYPHLQGEYHFCLVQ